MVEIMIGGDPLPGQGWRVEKVCFEAEQIREAGQAEDVLPKLQERIDIICDAAALDEDPTFLSHDEARQAGKVTIADGDGSSRPAFQDFEGGARGFARLMSNTPNDFWARQTPPDALDLFYQGLVEASENQSYTINGYDLQKIAGPNWLGVLTFVFDGESFQLDKDSKIGGETTYQLDGENLFAFRALSFGISEKVYGRYNFSETHQKVHDALVQLPFLQPVQGYDDISSDPSGSYRAGYFNSASFQDLRAYEKIPLGDRVGINITRVVDHPDDAQRVKIEREDVGPYTFDPDRMKIFGPDAFRYPVSLDGFGRLFVDGMDFNDPGRYVHLTDDYPIDKSTRFYLGHPVLQRAPDIAVLWTPGQEEMRTVDMAWARTLGCLPGDTKVQTSEGEIPLSELYERYMTSQDLPEISALGEDGEEVFQSDYKVTRRFLGGSQSPKKPSLQFITYEARDDSVNHAYVAHRDEWVTEGLLALTPNHFLFVERKGVSSWRRADDVQARDWITARNFGYTYGRWVVDNRSVSSQAEIETYEQEFPDVTVPVSFEEAQNDPDRGALDVYDIEFAYGQGQSHNFFVVDEEGNRLLVHNKML